MSNALDDLRQTLADVICGDRAVDNWQATPSDYDLADAIIAALPGRVLPLEWWEPSSGNNWTHGAKTLFGTYYVHIDGGRHNAWTELFHESGRIEQWDGPTRGNLEQSKGDAEAHYRGRIMAAFGIDTAAMKEGKDA